MRSLGHRIVVGRGVDNRRVSASYEGDLYIRGREYDIISIDRDGRYHLTEVKYRARAGEQHRPNAVERGWERIRDIFLRKKDEASDIGRFLIIARQLMFDGEATTMDDELTLSGRPLPGGDEVLSPDDFQINWVLINRRGTAIGADFSDGRELQQIIDEVLPFQDDE